MEYIANFFNFIYCLLLFLILTIATPFTLILGMLIYLFQKIVDFFKELLE